MNFFSGRDDDIVTAHLNSRLFVAPSPLTREECDEFTRWCGTQVKKPADIQPVSWYVPPPCVQYNLQVAALARALTQQLTPQQMCWLMAGLRAQLGLWS